MTTQSTVFDAHHCASVVSGRGEVNRIRGQWLCLLIALCLRAEGEAFQARGFIYDSHQSGNLILLLPMIFINK